MADPEHLSILKAGAAEWNVWRMAHPELSPDLRATDLRELDLRKVNFGKRDPYHSKQSCADLRGADLSGADLSEASLMGTDLAGALFSNANLRCANFTGARADGVSFKEAFLSGACFTAASLRKANLRDTPLLGSMFFHTDVTDADLRGTRYGGTHFGYEDLSASQIEGIKYYAPSPVSIQTIRLTAAGLASNPSTQGMVEAHFRGCGVSDSELEYFRSLIARPIEFYSCFISYSQVDKRFARRLFDALQQQGIRCWLDEHELLPGDNIYDQVNQGIRLWDKVLLCCSRASLSSWWVHNEIATAFEKEQRLQKERGKKIDAVIPLDLDGYLFEWDDGKAPKLKERLAADFKVRSEASFDSQIRRVIAALRSDGQTRRPPPRSRL